MIMNTNHSKMLIKLSKNNIKHYYNTDSVTVVSDVFNTCFEKEEKENIGM